MRNFLAAAVLMVFSTMICSPSLRAGEVTPDDCKANDCKAPLDRWFPQSNKTPSVELADYPKPIDDECAFYKFVWQSFLYLTQSENAGDPPRFVLLTTPNELFDVPNTPPNTAKMRVAAAPTRTAAKKKMLSLSVRNSPKTSRDIQAKAITQAGSQGVLVDQNNRCLYYGQHLNAEFVAFIRGTLGVTKAIDLDKVDKDRGFPEGCTELKSSWRALTDDEKNNPQKLAALKAEYFVTEAEVPTLFKGADNLIHANADKPRTEMVALVALHVVGTTPKHEEFIWGSFEHVKNSPTPSQAAAPGDGGLPISNKDFTFYPANTPKNQCNVNPVDELNPQLNFIDEAKQTLSPKVNVYREFNSGDDFLTVDEDVCNLNNAVRAKLNTIPELAVWSNYRLIGAVWLKDPATFVAGKKLPFPAVPPDLNDMFQGEKKLSNSTMETFTQHKQFNCFGCHNSAASDSPSGNSTMPGIKIKVSHAILNAYFEAKEATPTQP